MGLEREVRAPQAALWGFYPIKRDALLKELERCFLDKVWGPGEIPREYIGKYRALGGISPHAGYAYSGPCAAHLYKFLRENVETFDTVIIMGSNHTGLGGAITTTRRFVWSTPLGDIDTDIEFIDMLSKEYPVDDDPLAHYREHSVEVQLPFLQFVFGLNFKIVPIVVKEISSSEARSFAKALKDVAATLNRRVLVIASSDFTHHGAMYGYILFRENVAAQVRELDLMFIRKILELDTTGFLNMVEKKGSTICGPGAIAIAMEYTKLMNGKAELLKYYNSAELTGEEDIAVGYAAIAFYY